MIKTRVEGYKEFRKGFIAGFFTAVINAGEIDEFKVRDCRHFMKGENEWITFTQKEYTEQESGQKKYCPIFKYSVFAVEEEIKSSLLKEIKGVLNEEIRKHNAKTKTSESLPSNSSSLPF